MCEFFPPSSFPSYAVTKGRNKYAVKVMEDNRNLLVFHKEIAFQIRSKCPEIVDVEETYYFDDKLWVGATLRQHS